MPAKSFLIAVMDDDLCVRTALGNLLRSMGFRVSLFASAEHFLAADVGALNCHVCDIDMPGMSGWDLWDRMQDEDRRIPTILINACEDDRAKLPVPTGMRVFRKPFDGNRLAEAIHDLGNARG